MFSKICTPETVESGIFSSRFSRIHVDGRPIRKEKVVFTNENEYVWTGPKTCYQLRRLLLVNTNEYEYMEHLFELQVKD